MLQFHITFKNLPMIIKLPIPFVYARQKTEKASRPTTRTERIKFDRLIMILLFALTIVGAVLYA